MEEALTDAVYFFRILTAVKSIWPREAIEIQAGLHSDVAMCLDECPPAEATRDG